MISDEGQALGHKYESTQFGGAVWCYHHDLPTMICTFDDEAES